MIFFSMDWIDDGTYGDKNYNNIIENVKTETSSLYTLLLTIGVIVAITGIFKIGKNLVTQKDGKKRRESKEDIGHLILGIILLLFGVSIIFSVANSIGTTF